MGGDTGANRRVRAVADKQLPEFGDHTLRVCQRVKDRSLATNAIGVDSGSRITSAPRSRSRRAAPKKLNSAATWTSVVPRSSMQQFRCVH